jgi:hypothetical protein
MLELIFKYFTLKPRKKHLQLGLQTPLKQLTALPRPLTELKGDRLVAEDERIGEGKSKGDGRGGIFSPRTLESKSVPSLPSAQT